MKKYSYLLCLSFLFGLTSCLNNNQDDLPAFEENEITGVQKVEYRYISDEVSAASGQQVVKYVTLTIDNAKKAVDKDVKHVSIEVTVPKVSASFPDAERTKCSTKEIAVMVSLSTAARITPVGDAPKFGVPGDWTKPNKYVITAANGDTAEWTVEITKFNK